MNRNIVVGAVTAAVILAAISILSLTSPRSGTGGGQSSPTEKVSIVISSVELHLDARYIRMTVSNTGTVSVRLTRMTVKGTDLEGAQIQTKTLAPGEAANLDLGLIKAPQTFKGEVTFTIETDKGNFEQKYNFT